MTREDIYQKFVENILTLESLNARVEDIEEAKRWIYKLGTKPLNEKIKASVSENFRKLVSQLEVIGELPNTRKELTTFFRGAIEYTEKIPSVKLTLAFFPSEEFLKKITSWLANELGERAVVDVRLDEKIIAGATIEYDGEYRDYSFAAKLDEVIEQEIKNRLEAKK